MMKRTAYLVVTVAGTLGACSSDRSAGGGIEGSTAGAAAPDAEGAECNDLAFLAPEVESQFASGNPPAPAGGSIRPGTYVLTKATLYNADGSVGPTGQTIRKTAELTATTYEFVESEGTVAGGVTEQEHKSRTYVSSGTKLVQTGVCPPTAASSVSYSVIGNEVHLYAPNEFTVQVLTKR